MSDVLTKSPAERESGIELLRILAAMGVILLHYNNPGIGRGFSFAPEGSLNQQILLFTEGMYICAVNLFMVISGYFMCRKTRVSLRKPVELIIQLVVFELVLYAVNVLTGRAEFSWVQVFTACIPADYFVVLYSVTLILSPYINFIMSKLEGKQLRLLIAIIFLLFSVQPELLELLRRYAGIEAGVTTVGLHGADDGYTIVNFVMCYILGAGINYGIIGSEKLKSVHYFGIYAIIAMLIYKVRSWDYFHPLVVMEAVAAFLVFKNLNIRSVRINKLARASFTVYLLHQYFVVRAGVKIFVQGSTALLLAHLLLAPVAIYLICYVVYVAWNAITAPVFKRFWDKTGDPEINLESV